MIVNNKFDNENIDNIIWLNVNWFNNIFELIAWKQINVELNIYNVIK